MNKKEIRLSRKEIQLMLQGSLSWSEIEERSNAANKLVSSADKEQAAKKTKTEAEESGSLLKSNENLLRSNENPLPAKENSYHFTGNMVRFLIVGVATMTLSSWVFFVFFIG